MIGDSIQENNSMLRQIVVSSLWAPLCIAFALNSGNIGCAELMDIFRKNAQEIVIWTWYAMMAASSCIFCMLARVLLMFVEKQDVGSLMTIVFNTGLAVGQSLVLESLETIDLLTPNSPIEEAILSFTAGYYFYEMFYMRTRKSLGPSLKILTTITVTSFIITSLGNGTGASGVLTFLFLFSSAVPILKLRYLGSSKFVNSVAYQSSIWTGYAFALFQWFINAPGFLLKFWDSPAFRFEQFECAYYIFLYSVAIGTCFGLIEIVHMLQIGQHGKNEKPGKSRYAPTNNNLVTYKRGYGH